MVLDGAMIAIATIILTVVHPGLAFHGQWHAADWNFKKGKTDAEIEIGSVEAKN